MVCKTRTASASDMTRRHHVKYETQSARRKRQVWLRAGVWLFILVFAFSIVGGLLIGGVIQIKGQ